MLAFRYAALLALVVWVGAMVALALIVAPTAFRVLGAADPAVGRTLAGLVFGDVMRQFHRLAYACGGVLVVSLFVLKFVGPPPAAFKVRAGLAAVMLATVMYSGLVVSPEIDAIQSSVHGSIERLPPDAAGRLRFDHLHQLSTILMTTNMALGALLLVWYARE
jgi:uncharacterized membrane protein